MFATEIRPGDVIMIDGLGRVVERAQPMDETILVSFFNNFSVMLRPADIIPAWDLYVP